MTATTPPAPALTTLTLVNATAILQGDRLVVDQGPDQEFAYATLVTTGPSSTVQVSLQNPHVGTYPVTVEGGESTARYYLRQCVAIADRIARVAGRAGVKKADEVEFFASTPQQKSAFDELLGLQRYWRIELATCLGVPNLREERAGAGGMVEMF